ncbi:N-substituted formamide deformylase precursor [Planctomycetes bacterium CA13]|uniref:N-substituted formamide deformylase n=1 Tax=Novipirellula herctigrandis TaxID=2527986 RepID=A0A5C5ZB86_9BACT|nr:N-substituted formamide deformylase precursor [Planctomycetes bacterium CA13]
MNCHMKAIVGSVFAIAVLPAIAFAQQKPADTLFTGGKVYTVNDAQPWAEAVAVTGNQIVFVGSSADAKAFIGDDTDVVDCAGKMVMPGFISAQTI